MNGWIALVTAGAVEVAWARSIAPTEQFTRPLATVLCLVLMAGAVYLLSRAMATVPVATAYVVFTGIGAAGTVLVGIVVDRDPTTATRLMAVVLVLGGVLLARTTTGA